MHAIVPPHPGPVTAATELGASIGLTLVLGIVVAVIAWAIGVYEVSMKFVGKVYVPVNDTVIGGTDDDEAPANPPPFGLVLGIGAIG